MILIDEQLKMISMNAENQLSSWKSQNAKKMNLHFQVPILTRRSADIYH